MSQTPSFNLILGDHLPHYTCECSLISTHYELQFVDGGGVHLDYEHHSYDLKAHSAWLIWPGIRYHYQPLPEYGYWNHRYAVLPTALVEPYRQLGLVSFLPWHGMFAEDFDQMLKRLFDHSPLAAFKARHAFESILLASHRPQPAGDFPLEDILQKIARHQKLEDIARDCNLSLRSFFRKFNETMHCSPRQYYISERIKQVTYYLTDTDLPIKEIARKLYFSDSAHLTRHYRQHTGKTPQQMRQEGGGKPQPKG